MLSSSLPSSISGEKLVLDVLQGDIQALKSRNLCLQVCDHKPYKLLSLPGV